MKTVRKSTRAIDRPQRRGAEIPRGFRLKAQGCEARATLGIRRRETTNPEGVAPLVPKISFLPFRLMFAQQSAQLVLETHLPVMLLLSGNILLHLLQIGLADGEG